MNIDINPSILSSTIKSLKNDNENIQESMNLIYENVNKLMNSNIWKSPEKEKIMDEIIPYIQKSKKIIFNELNNCVIVLNDALNNYINQNNILKNQANKLTNFKEL